jgi:hypothetical protein
MTGQQEHQKSRYVFVGLDQLNLLNGLWCDKSAIGRGSSDRCVQGCCHYHSPWKAVSTKVLNLADTDLKADLSC